MFPSSFFTNSRTCACAAHWNWILTFDLISSVSFLHSTSFFVFWSNLMDRDENKRVTEIGHKITFSFYLFFLRKDIVKNEEERKHRQITSLLSIPSFFFVLVETAAPSLDDISSRKRKYSRQDPICEYRFSLCTHFLISIKKSFLATMIFNEVFLSNLLLLFVAGTVSSQLINGTNFSEIEKLTTTLLLNSFDSI